jgi:hypothetical protein
MRRSIALSFPLVVLVIAVVGGWSSSAAVAAGRNSCPDRQRPCASKLTISASANPLPAEEPLVVEGKLSGHLVSGARVALWQRMPAQRSFHLIARTHAGRHGKYEFALHPTTDRSYFVTAAGLQSHTLHERVRALVTLIASK